MKKRSLIAITLGLSLVSLNYSKAYFSNELLLEGNTISIGEFEVLEDETLNDEIIENVHIDKEIESEGNETNKIEQSNILSE